MPPDPATQLLADLVRIPSQNPMGRLDVGPAQGYLEGGLTDFLESWLCDRDIECHRRTISQGRTNLIARVEPPASQHTILFDVHQDTVPVDGMTIDPFAALIENGRLYGRGACDVKGSMAAMLLAVERLARERPRGAAAVMLALTVDEEYTHTGSSALAESLPQLGAPIDLALVAEPTRFEIITTHKGAVRWAIEAAGRACHSSTPYLGDNAIYRMARVVTALEAHAASLAASAPDPVLGAPSLSIGRIQGGVAANIVPESCRIEIDRRVLPGESPESARAQATDALRLALDTDQFSQLTIEPPWVQMPALRSTVPTQVLSALADVIESITHQRPGTGGVPFGTDAGPLGQAGVPCIVFGPGDIAQAHTCDEWIDLSQVAAAVEVYYDLARKLPTYL